MSDHDAVERPITMAWRTQRAIRGGEVSGLGDRMASALLSFLRSGPEIIGHDAEMGHIDRDPL